MNPTPAVVPNLAMNTGCAKILEAQHVEVVGISPMGPMGVLMRLVAHRRNLKGSLIATQSNYPFDKDPDVEWLHASLAWNDVMPTYGDLQMLHRAVFGRRRYAYQVFAPEAKHIDGSVRDGLPAHEYALHLFGRVDGKPALPEFGMFGHI